MADRVYTQMQQLAIDTRDKTLLVSAAAGSGKTATLTERIIRSVTDEKNPIDINSILVVTFTNSAAGELRERIGKAVRGAIAQRPDDERLTRQLHLLPGATISTIDAFLGDVLRANAERVGVSPSFRVADEAEARLMCESVLEGLINSVFNGEREDVATYEEFSELCDALSDSKSVRGLTDVFETVYENLISSENGIDTLLPLIELYKSESELPVEERTYGRYIMKRAEEMVSYYLNQQEKISSRLYGIENEPKLCEWVRSDSELLRSLSGIKKYSDLKNALDSISFAKKPSHKGEYGSAIEEYTALRDMLKGDVKEMSARFFSYSEGEWYALYPALFGQISVLHRFLSAFDSAFFDEKRRKGVLRFSDIERLSYKCLVKDGEPTDIARALKDKFSAVYIDEYQDVNSLQDKIFSAISRENNRFMVGDIKQSIYAFRSARPEIFANMKKSFPKLIDGTNESFATIFMSQNFRCDESVVNFINKIFDKAFGVFGENIGYEYSDRLTYSKNSDSSKDIPVGVYLFDKNETDPDSEDGEDGGRYEPAFVANQIRELIDNGSLSDGSPIKPSDIAVIMRSVRGRSQAYADAIEARGVAVKIVEDKNFFLNGEVLLALCYLNAIDNPHRDIYLAGLMRSPLFDFSADELLKIRLTYPAPTLYSSLKAYTVAEGYTKGEDFIKTLNLYRSIAEGMNVHTLIAKLYKESGLLSLAAESGGKENLMLLYDYARSFDGGAFRGLYSFINYINSVINKKVRFDATKDEENTNAVKIVTVHGSKGLEYPVVFYVDTGRKFSAKESRERITYAEDYGIAMYLRSSDGLALVKNPVREVILDFNKVKSFEEELRILYVALTRARERLIITGERSKKREDFDREIGILKQAMTPYTKNHLKSHLSVMLMSDVELNSVEKANEEAESEQITASQNTTASELTPFLVSREELVRRFNYEYPDSHLTAVPEKLSVSRLYPEVLDGRDDTAQLLAGDTLSKSVIIPTFVGAQDGAELSRKKGIATHTFMQFTDFKRLGELGARAELSRMIEDGYISREDGELVRLDEIEAFVASSLFKRISSAKNIYRELRFNVNLPAKSFTQNAERQSAVSDKMILVQGVIDCVIEMENGEIYLIDYKTDRLTEYEIKHRRAAEEKLIRAHSEQLSYYKKAVSTIFGKAPTSVEVYSLHLGDTVKITTREI